MHSQLHTLQLHTKIHRTDTILQNLRKLSVSKKKKKKQNCFLHIFKSFITHEGIWHHKYLLFHIPAVDKKFSKTASLLVYPCLKRLALVNSDSHLSCFHIVFPYRMKGRVLSMQTRSKAVQIDCGYPNVSEYI